MAFKWLFILSFLIFSFLTFIGYKPASESGSISFKFVNIDSRMPASEDADFNDIFGYDIPKCNKSSINNEIKACILFGLYQFMSTPPKGDFTKTENILKNLKSSNLKKNEFENSMPSIASNDSDETSNYSDLVLAPFEYGYHNKFSKEKFKAYIDLVLKYFPKEEVFHNQIELDNQSHYCSYFNKYINENDKEFGNYFAGNNRIELQNSIENLEHLKSLQNLSCANQQKFNAQISSLIDNIKNEIQSLDEAKANDVSRSISFVNSKAEYNFDIQGIKAKFYMTECSEPQPKEIIKKQIQNLDLNTKLNVELQKRPRAHTRIEFNEDQHSCKGYLDLDLQGTSQINLLSNFDLKEVYRKGAR